MADETRKFDVSLVTPDGPAFEGAVEMIVVPGAAGEIGVLARHAPLIATLKAGSTRVYLDRQADDVREYATGPGFFKVEQDRALALVHDAMIDTLHWSGGNTSLDGLACGLPIVTLPGAYMRGRQSAGMLGLLGLPELVAHDRADYLAIAARLVRDAGWRRELTARIPAAPRSRAQTTGCASRSPR